MSVSHSYYERVANWLSACAAARSGSVGIQATQLACISAAVRRCSSVRRSFWRRWQKKENLHKIAEEQRDDCDRDEQARSAERRRHDAIRVTTAEL